MKRVLGIIGSPRKMGNSELMVKEISKKLTVPHDLRIIRLMDFDLKPCRGCYACIFGDKGCVIKDDYNVIMDEILAADAYIAAAPAYFLGPMSLMKLLTDRWLSLTPHADKMWGRPGVAVAVAGINGREGYTELGLESFLKMLLADIRGTEVVYGALPGEVLRNPDNRALAARLASSLFQETREESGPSCPVCGGRTFRFYGGNKVRCMLCSNYGAFAAGEDEPSFHIAKGEHEMFTSLEASHAHREWLMGMKNRFLAEKGELKALTAEYAEHGTIVSPEPRE